MVQYPSAPARANRPGLEVAVPPVPGPAVLVGVRVALAQLAGGALVGVPVQTSPAATCHAVSHYAFTIPRMLRLYQRPMLRPKCCSVLASAKRRIPLE
jgi:hypothetical protein